jgi:hypothetical protein
VLAKHIASEINLSNPAVSLLEQRSKRSFEKLHNIEYFVLFFKCHYGECYEGEMRTANGILVAKPDRIVSIRMAARG